MRKVLKSCQSIDKKVHEGFPLLVDSLDLILEHVTSQEIFVSQSNPKDFYHFVDGIGDSSIGDSRYGPIGNE
jgi:hypothetical protein